MPRALPVFYEVLYLSLSNDCADGDDGDNGSASIDYDDGDDHSGSVWFATNRYPPCKPLSKSNATTVSALFLTVSVSHCLSLSLSMSLSAYLFVSFTPCLCLYVSAYLI